MTNLSVHRELLHGTGIDPLAGWLLPSTFVVGGMLAAALIGASFWTPPSEPIGEVLAPELPSIGAIIGASAPQVMRVAAVAAAPPQSSFAFGFLEFDWDPNARGGVPGFDSWPKHDLRVAEAIPPS